MTFEALRILLLAACGFAVVGPMLMPSMEPTAIVRLLLLPIPRGTLYAAQAGGALSEPWILIALPVVLARPARARGWRRGARGRALPRGGRLCSSSASSASRRSPTLLLHLVVRDRRRGELLALLFIVVVPAIALLPGLLLRLVGRCARHGAPAALDPDARLGHAARRMWRRPSFRRSSSRARRDPRHSTRPTPRSCRSLVLFASATFLHALGLLTFVAAARLALGRNTTANEPAGRSRPAVRAAVPVAGQRRRGAGAAPPGAAHAARTIDRALAVRGLRALCDRHLPAGTDGARIRQPHQRPEPRHLRWRRLPARDPAVCAEPVRHRRLGADAGLALPAQHATSCWPARRWATGSSPSVPALVVVLVAFVLFPEGSPWLWLSLPPATRGHLRDRRTGSGRHSRRSFPAPSTSTASAGAATRTASPVSWDCSSSRPRACRQSSSRSSRRASFTGRH